MSKPHLPLPGEGKRGETGHLGYLLRQAAASYRLRAERVLAEQGVTLPQFAVLTMLNAYPGASNADIARLSLLTPQTVNVIIANLERAGAIAREPHETHGRILKIALTEQGTALLSACRTLMNEIETGVVKDMSEDEERIIRCWLAEMARDLTHKKTRRKRRALI